MKNLKNFMYAIKMARRSFVVMYYGIRNISTNAESKRNRRLKYLTAKHMIKLLDGIDEELFGDFPEETQMMLNEYYEFFSAQMELNS